MNQTGTESDTAPGLLSSSAPGLVGLAERLRATHAGGRTRPAEWRCDQLRALERLLEEREDELLDAGGHEQVVGGEVDVADRYVAPTVLRGVRRDSAVMGEEVFGPILPVLTFSDLEEPIAAINAGDKPLALNVFAGRATADRVLDQTSSGGACVNDAMVHVGISELPFGGVGGSGYGTYHGRWGFETSSHSRAVVRRPSWFPDSPVLRPPYSAWKRAIVRRLS